MTHPSPGSFLWPMFQNAVLWGSLKELAFINRGGWYWVPFLLRKTRKTLVLSKVCSASLDQCIPYKASKKVQNTLGSIKNIPFLFLLQILNQRDWVTDCSGQVQVPTWYLFPNTPKMGKLLMWICKGNLSGMLGFWGHFLLVRLSCKWVIWQQSTAGTSSLHSDSAAFLPSHQRFHGSTRAR